MELVGMISFFVACIIALVFGVILMIKAFQTSVLWGLGYIFVPFVSLIFVGVHWEVAKKPFLRGLLCIPFFLIAFFMSPVIQG